MFKSEIDQNKANVNKIQSLEFEKQETSNNLKDEFKRQATIKDDMRKKLDCDQCQTIWQTVIEAKGELPKEKLSAEHYTTDELTLR